MFAIFFSSTLLKGDGGSNDFSGYFPPRLSDHFVASFCRRRYSGTRKTRVYLPEFDLETTHHTTSRPAYLPEIRFACGLYAFFMLYCVECDTHEQARSRRLWPRGRGTREPPHIYPNTQAPAHGMCKKKSCRKTYPEFSTVPGNEDATTSWTYLYVVMRRWQTEF